AQHIGDRSLAAALEVAHIDGADLVTAVALLKRLVEYGTDCFERFRIGFADDDPRVAVAPLDHIDDRLEVNLLVRSDHIFSSGDDAGVERKEGGVTSHRANDVDTTMRRGGVANPLKHFKA